MADPWRLLKKNGVPEAEIELLRTLDASKYRVSPAFGKAARKALVDLTRCDNITDEFFSRTVTTYATAHRDGDGGGDGPGSLVNFLVCIAVHSAGMGVPMTGMLFEKGCNGGK